MKKFEFGIDKWNDYTSQEKRANKYLHYRWYFGMLWRRWLPIKTFLLLLLFNVIQFMGGEYWIHFHEGEENDEFFVLIDCICSDYFYFSLRPRNVVIRGWKGETPSTLMLHINCLLLNIFYYILEFFVGKF